jgi:ADP-dependent phosphofructokinase/glucokinase
VHWLACLISPQSQVTLASLDTLACRIDQEMQTIQEEISHNTSNKIEEIQEQLREVKDTMKVRVHEFSHFASSWGNRENHLQQFAIYFIM